MKKLKICFAASSGGHLEQLLMLSPLMARFDSFLLTERTAYAIQAPVKIHYLSQVNRRERGWLRSMASNALRSLKIYWKERPNAVICTGALATVPMCLLCKLCGGRLIFLESFAKVTSPTQTGKLLYRFADRFYVQWPAMQKVYPGALYLGGIY